VCGLEVTAWSQLFEAVGIDWQVWARAWARVLPSVLLIPAFGAQFLPAPARAVLGLGLAGLLVPALSETATHEPLAVTWLGEFLRGVPVALIAATALWATAMAGGLFDDLRGSGQSQVSLLPEAATPVATLLALFACAAFLKLGGVEALVEGLMANEPGAGRVWARTAEQIVGGIHVAFALAAPFLVASVVFDVAGALIARAASPAAIQSLLSPLRALALLASLALVFRALLSAITRLVSSA
jgi:flagellar biosynthesis protein FliR